MQREETQERTDVLQGVQRWTSSEVNCAGSQDDCAEKRVKARWAERKDNCAQRKDGYAECCEGVDTSLVSSTCLK